MDKVRFGIVGCGMISDFHAAAICENVSAELTGVYDAWEPARAACAKKHQTRCFSTLEEMLACPEVDAVSICTPNGLHAEIALAALRAGKHVVVEKPMAICKEDLDDMVRASWDSRRRLCVISQLRFSPAIQAVKQALEAGALGRLVSVSLSMMYYRSEAYYASSPWRGTWNMDGGGALMNQGIHGIDLLTFLAGPVQSVYAHCETAFHEIETEDSAHALLRFQSGAWGTVEASTACPPGMPRRMALHGTKGSIVLHEDKIVQWLADTPRPESGEARVCSHSGPAALSSAGHAAQYKNFTNALLAGESLLVDANEGRRPVEIILAMYESSKKKCVIQL